jgi:triosephosphate isomerase
MGKIIVANWKMNGSLEFIRTFLPSIKPVLATTANKVIICPPYPFLISVSMNLQGTPTRLGAQNCHFSPQGAFTGEISASMLADIGCEVVIVGHSERRTQFGEDDALVNAKVSAVHAAGMTAIVCVGESMSIRESGQAIDTVPRQLHASLPSSTNSQNTMVAYEPIWAIGTGVTPILEEIIEMHQALHTTIQMPLPLLYGGSVTDQNAADIMALPHVDGVLVGGASLKTESFKQIVEFLNINKAVRKP